MKLLTKAIEKALPKRYSQENNPDPICHAKFFTPWGAWTWFAIEYDAEERIFFGYVFGHEAELGYFRLDELEAIRGPGGLRIERDRWFEASPLSTVKEYWSKSSR